MKRILLLSDDYAEASKWQAAFKKVGLDALSSSTDLRLGDQLLNFPAELVLVHGRSKFSSLAVGQKLREIRYAGKVLLILPQGAKPTPADLAKCRVDGLLDSSLGVDRLLERTTKVLGLDPAPYLEKYSRWLSSIQSDRQPQVGTPVAPPLPSQASNAERAQRYRRMLEGVQIDSTQTSHSREQVQAVQKQLSASWDFDFLKEVDKLKRQFTQALFKKGSAKESGKKG